MQYHFGTMAVGSFILATIRLVRFVMMYLEKKTRAAQRNNKYVRSCANNAPQILHGLVFYVQLQYFYVYYFVFISELSVL